MAEENGGPVIAPPDPSVVLGDPALTRVRLDQRSLVLELGRGDDDLLESFAAHGVRILRLEAAQRFNELTARRVRQEHGRADLIIVRDVLCPTADCDALVSGVHLLLAWNGTLLLELPHDGALSAVQGVLERHALRAYDIAEQPTRSGAPRAWGCHAADVRRTTHRLRERVAS
jgi:hypothetical protein